VKKIIVIFLVFLILFTGFSIVASGVKVWPGKHYITINKWYGPGEEVKNPIIHVTNTESYGINVSVRINAPGSKSLSGGYSNIPDVSWVRTVPEVIYIPAGSSGELEVIIEVPESQQSLHYNEKWEAYVVISPPLTSGGGINVQTELAVKLFIKTPTGEAAGFQYIHILLFFITLIILMCIVFFYVGKKKRSATLFYFKKKK